MNENRLNNHPRVTADPDVCGAYGTDASGLTAVPHEVARPENEGELVDLLRICNDKTIGVTPQGLRSSTTGASVPYGSPPEPRDGLALSLEKMNKVLEIDPERRIAVVEPGVVTADLKAQVRAAGLFYPPDPTSEEECTLGGNIACNASGSRSYKYGTTRDYVRALRVVLANGNLIEPRRIETDKNAAGYFGFQNPVDLWIGSEGTLGVVTRIELSLLAREPDFFGAMVFFPTWQQAITFVLAADHARRDGRLAPRCLELFGHSALGLLQDIETPLSIPTDAAAAIFFEEEIEAGQAAVKLEAWEPLITKHGATLDTTLVAQSTAEKSELRRLRHTIPSEMNERGQRSAVRGGRRVSTDFAVPLHRLPELMGVCFRLMDDGFSGFTVAYGHVGNGHPHFNLLAEDPDALVRAEATVQDMVRVALSMGGTLSAEHGIGKVKVPFFEALYPAWIRDTMRAAKEALDPRGILSPGNLFR